MLYFVATPIGNLGDITLRAIETLKSVDVIACEDTRHSLKLLNSLEIKKQLISYHKFNEKASGEKIIALLKDGKDVAVISDAGTPIVSDPGSVLVQMLIENDLPFTVIPGANAFVPALILSGLSAQRFVFIGFLPTKKRDREELLRGYKDVDATLIFYSAPHDIVKDVEDLAEILGNRKAVAVKEITKIYESRYEFNLSEGFCGEAKGEFVLLVEGGSKQNDLLSLSIEEHIQHYISSGLDKKEAIKKVAKDRNLPKNEVYKFTIE